MRASLRRSLPVVILCFAFASAAAAKEKETYGTLNAVLNTSALQPGKKAVVGVVFDVKKGYHTQSHTPSKEEYIPFNLTLDENASLITGTPVYPEGEERNYPNLGPLNVYEGKVVVYLPIEVKPDAPLGETKI